MTAITVNAVALTLGALVCAVVWVAFGADTKEVAYIAWYQLVGVWQLWAFTWYFDRKKLWYVPSNLDR